MELLKADLGPFVERELVGAMQAGLSPQIIRGFADDPNPANCPGRHHFDDRREQPC